IDTNTQKHFSKKVTIEIPYEKLDLVLEQLVDFESLQANGFDVKKLFQDQGWLGYFDILNGPVYTQLVKDFWKRCDIITQEEADKEYALKVAENPEKNKGKSRTELGLREFIETEIRSSCTGYEVTITQSTIAELLRITNKGIFKTFTPSSGRKSDYVERIAQRCYIKEDDEPTNKVSDLKPLQ
ncbi:hypothetical protein A2U01_0044331, partial [Trifolium medium]|nr:hypothetical protein [Trifolium medium]